MVFFHGTDCKDVNSHGLKSVIGPMSNYAIIMLKAKVVLKRNKNDFLNRISNTVFNYILE